MTKKTWPVRGNKKHGERLISMGLVVLVTAALGLATPFQNGTLDQPAVSGGVLYWIVPASYWAGRIAIIATMAPSS